MKSEYEDFFMSIYFMYVIICIFWPINVTNIYYFSK